MNTQERNRGAYPGGGFTQRPNTAALFVNRKRGDNAKAPNLKGTGNIVIDGGTYDLDIAAWTRESPKAGRWLSLSIELKGETTTAPVVTADRDEDGQF